jgi:hypothetical protein
MFTNILKVQLKLKKGNKLKCYLPYHLNFPQIFSLLVGFYYLQNLVHYYYFDHHFLKNNI